MKTTSHSIVALLATLSAVPPGALASFEHGSIDDAFSTANEARGRNDLASRDVLCSDGDQVRRSVATH